MKCLLAYFRNVVVVMLEHFLKEVNTLRNYLNLLFFEVLHHNMTKELF